MLREYYELVHHMLALDRGLKDAAENLHKVQQEIEVLTMAQQDAECSDEHLEQEERKLYSELDGVRSLLRSVTDLTQYQRREMQDNLAVESEIDVEIQTQHASMENLTSNSIQNNSRSAPRSLLKRKGSAADLRKSPVPNQSSSSNVPSSLV